MHPSTCKKLWFLQFCDLFIIVILEDWFECVYGKNRVPSNKKENFGEKNLFFVDILKVTEEKSRIGICKPLVRFRIRTQTSWIRNSGNNIFVFSYRKRVKQRLIRIDECVETNNYSDSGIVAEHLSASFLDFRAVDMTKISLENSVVQLFVSTLFCW